MSGAAAGAETGQGRRREIGDRGEEEPMRSTRNRRSAVVQAAALCLLVAPAPARAGSPADASCSVLDRAQVAAVQEATVVAADSRSRSVAGLELATCFYRAADHSRSVSFEVVSSADDAPEAATRRWQELFHPPTAAGAPEKPRSRRFAGDVVPADAATAGRTGALPVAALGDEAFYVGTAAYGALYVLQGPVYLRLSVGGPGDLDAKLARARALAEQALTRLAVGLPSPERGAS